MNDRTRLQEHLIGRHTLIWIPTYEERDALVLVREASINSGKRVWMWSAATGVRDGLLENSAPTADTTNAGAALAYWTERVEHDSLLVTLDLSDHLADPVVHRALRDLLHALDEKGSQLVMIDHAESLPGAISAHALRFDLSLPDERELEKILASVLRRANEEKSIRIESGSEGLRAVARNLRGLTRRQAERIAFGTIARDRTLSWDDIERVLEEKRRLLSSDGVLDTIDAPASLDELGGLGILKSWLQQRDPSLFEISNHDPVLAPPRGILILGVQGAGKSLCAKAIATAWKRALLRLDPGALYDRYIGESERRLRSALGQAEAMAPVVLWIDEIEKGFASAASRSIDGGLSQRMFGSLLTWMQEHRAPVFVAATANDIEALPPELLRKGRFDEIFFVDLPSADVRRRIFEIHLAKREIELDRIDLDELRDASRGRSGAEIEQAIISGLYTSRAARKQLATKHLVQALESSPPLSVTMRERIERLRAWAHDRCVMADDEGPLD